MRVVIDRRELILDGTSLETAFRQVDAASSRPPLGYMINCAYPSFLKAAAEPVAVIRRLVGFQANASSRDHSELEASAQRLTDDLDDWGRRMVALNRSYGIKILGGCCGTCLEHLRSIAGHLS